MAPSTTSTTTIRLDRPEDYRLFMAEVKRKATSTGLWIYLDPAVVNKPSLEAPAKPTPGQVASTATVATVASNNLEVLYSDLTVAQKTEF